ncbi:MAG: hypothetical protein HY336_01560 [Candidatus Doudnabacteria bacterium]|nr:hypothetical protein [Candidatus Doudnabacteria bacterium]
MKKLQIFIGCIVVLAFALTAFAATPGLNYPNQPTGLPGSNQDTATGWVTKIINIALAIVGILAVAYLIYGGFRYITSAGNQEAAEAGKKAIINAIVGLIIIILSYVIIIVIMNALGRQGWVQNV